MSDKNGIPAVLTPDFRLSFPCLANPKENKRGKMMYSGVMLFPKGEEDLLRGIKDHIRAIRAAKWPDPAIWPQLRKTLKDGDVQNSKGKIPNGHAGMWVVNFSTQYPIGCVDEKNIPVLDIIKKFYGGCWCHALIKGFGYDVDGNMGISFGMECIQFVRDDDAFSGRRDPRDVFKPLVGAGGTSGTAGEEDDGGL